MGCDLRLVHIIDLKLREVKLHKLESAMELGFLMLTDHSEALNGKVYAMGGGWNMLRFPQLPQEWGFGIAFAIDVPWDQTNRRHNPHPSQ